MDENTRLRNRIAELESLVRELRGMCGGSIVASHSLSFPCYFSQANPTLVGRTAISVTGTRVRGGIPAPLNFRRQPSVETLTGSMTTTTDFPPSNLILASRMVALIFTPSTWNHLIALRYGTTITNPEIHRRPPRTSTTVVILTRPRFLAGQRRLIRPRRDPQAQYTMSNDMLPLARVTLVAAVATSKSSTMMAVSRSIIHPPRHPPPSPFAHAAGTQL